MGFVGTAPSTTTITLPNGQTIAFADWIDDKFYSTVQLSNGQVTAVEAFSTTQSQPIPGGTRPNSAVDTNIIRAGSNGLPKDYEMMVFALAVQPIRASAGTGSASVALTAFSDPPQYRTFWNVERLVALDYKYNGKSYSTGTMTDYPAGHGLYEATTASNADFVQNGFPDARSRQAMVLPIHERENLYYTWIFQPVGALTIQQQPTVQGETILSAFDVKAFKYGLIKRPVT